MYDGIEYTVDLTRKKGNRIVEITRNKKAFDQEKMYKVAMNNYRASGGGDYTFIKGCKTILDTQMEIVQLLIDYIIEHKNISLPKQKNIKFL
jgi:2',3'-cyclic-nucleotide 2'-phosphodiesterase/3'-nucleotidase